MSKCFVISPFGQPDSDVRRFADQVLDKLIRPALGPDMELDDAQDLRNGLQGLRQMLQTQGTGQGTELTVERADEARAKFGSVMKRIAESIVNFDMIIAVLWRHNPNVYYELAIAHAAAKPVVLLRHKDEAIPFDILGEETIEFDLERLARGDTAYEAAKVSELRKAAEAAAADFKKNRVSNKLFAFHSPMLDPLGRQHNQYVVHENFRAFSYADWSKSINEARSFIRFAGVSLFDLTRIDNNLFELPAPGGAGSTAGKSEDEKLKRQCFLLDLLLLRIVIGGIDVHVMIMDEDNPGLEHMLHSGAEKFGKELGISFSDLFLAQVRQEIQMSARRWTEFGALIEHALEKIHGHKWPEQYLKERGINPNPDRRGSFQLTKVKKGLLYNRLSMTDNDAIITPFFFEFGRNGSGPAVYTVADTPLYNAHMKDYEYLVRANATSTAMQEVAVRKPSY